MLETAELAQAADLAGLDADAAAQAADLLVAAGILGPRRPLAFAHPIVRAGILEEVPPAERMRAHRRAAELLAVREDRGERVAEHLLATEPTGDAWTVARLTEAAREASRRGAPESAASYLRRVLAEPPAAGARPRSCSTSAWPRRPRASPRARPTCARRCRRRPTTTCASAPRSCSPISWAAREQIAPAIEVIDLAAARLADNRGRARVLLESMATGAGMLDAATAPRLASRMRAMRRAADHAHVPREVLAVAALVAVHANEPATTCIALAQRALAGGPRVVPEPTDLPWFAQATVALIWADALAEAQAPLDAGVAESRATGDPALFGMSLAQRAWLLLRLGDLQGAEGDARSVLEARRAGAPAALPQARGGDPRQRVDRAGRARARAERASTRFGVDEGARTHTSAVLRLARGRLHLRPGRPSEALADTLSAGQIVVATGSTCPGYLAWRSGAALAHAALGEREEGLRLALEEVELARAFGAQRTLGVALRAAGVVAGGAEGEALLREGVQCLERAGIALERARALAELGVLCARQGAAPRRARCCARRSTSPTTRAPRRWPTWPRPSYGRPAPSRGASPSAGSRRSRPVSGAWPSWPATASPTARSLRRSSSPCARSRVT